MTDPVKWSERAQAVRELIGPGWRVDAYFTGLNIGPSPDLPMYGHAELTFAMLQSISDACGGTKNINVKYDAGWSGTEETPGDGASMVIEVRT